MFQKGVGIVKMPNTAKKERSTKVRTRKYLISFRDMVPQFTRAAITKYYRLGG